MASLRERINSMCKWCIYDPAGVGTWREQVEACNCVNCPLFGVRPVSGGKSANNIVDKRINRV